MAGERIVLLEGRLEETRTLDSVRNILLEAHNSSGALGVSILELGVDGPSL